MVQNNLFKVFSHRHAHTCAGIAFEPCAGCGQPWCMSSYARYVRALRIDAMASYAQLPVKKHVGQKVSGALILKTLNERVFTC